MSFDSKTKEIANNLQKGNTKAMTPITLIHIAAIFIYIVVAFQGLVTPAKGFYFEFMAKVILCLVAVVVGNTVIFEIWVSRKLRVASKILAWDGDYKTLPEDQVVTSLIALIDFPHQFIIRFLTQWVIMPPFAYLMIRFFYAIPWQDLLYVTLGTIAILTLMSTLHYFSIKALYDKPLAEALHKYPTFFQRPELAKRRVAYGRKVFIYLLILVGAMTWITIHLNIVGRTRTFTLQRDSFMEEQVKVYGSDLAKSITNAVSPNVLNASTNVLLGSSDESAFIFDDQGDELLGRELSELHRKIKDEIPQISSTLQKTSAGQSIKKFFSFNRILVIRITDRVMLAYTGNNQYIVTVDELKESAQSPVAATLLTIKPRFRLSQMVLAQTVSWMVMFIIALLFSIIFAHYIQREMMQPIFELISSSKQVASGDLSASTPVMADDELGELSVYHLRMVASLSQMVKQVEEAAVSVDQASIQISERTADMAHGSQTQSVAVDETSASIMQMNQSIANIAQSADTLAGSAHDSSASIIQMSATIEQVAAGAENLSVAVDQTSSSVEQMSSSIKEVAASVKNAAGKAGETATGMRQMSKAIKEVDKISVQSAQVAEQVTRDAESGAAAVQSTISGIERIRQSSEQAAQVIEKLSKRASEIGRILNVIEDVTEETNLLALNAAIIAAQAGEHGRGFAVVADEIKDLAERTQASTSVIAEQIQAVQDDAKSAVSAVNSSGESVGDGVKLAQEAGEALRKILDSTNNSMSLARRISESTKEQNRQADEVLSFFENIVGIIGQVNTATQEQTKGSEQIIMAAERMRDIAGQVKNATREQAIGSRQITQAIEHISGVAGNINSSQSEQKKAAEQALSAINKIAEIAQNNVMDVEKVSGSVGNLQGLAQELRNLLGSFLIDLDKQE